MIKIAEIIINPEKITFISHTIDTTIIHFEGGEQQEFLGEDAQTVWDYFSSAVVVEL